MIRQIGIRLITIVEPGVSATTGRLKKHHDLQDAGNILTVQVPWRADVRLVDRSLAGQTPADIAPPRVVVDRYGRTRRQVSELIRPRRVVQVTVQQDLVRQVVCLDHGEWPLWLLSGDLAREDLICHLSFVIYLLLETSPS